jgi:hypothetical protein
MNQTLFHPLIFAYDRSVRNGGEGQNSRGSHATMYELNNCEKKRKKERCLGSKSVCVE